LVPIESLIRASRSRASSPISSSSISLSLTTTKRWSKLQTAQTKEMKIWSSLSYTRHERDTKQASKQRATRSNKNEGAKATASARALSISVFVSANWFSRVATESRQFLRSAPYWTLLLFLLPSAHTFSPAAHTRHDGTQGSTKGYARSLARPVGYVDPHHIPSVLDVGPVHDRRGGFIREILDRYLKSASSRSRSRYYRSHLSYGRSFGGYQRCLISGLVLGRLLGLASLQAVVDLQREVHRARRRHQLVVVLLRADGTSCSSQRCRGRLRLIALLIVRSTI